MILCVRETPASDGPPAFVGIMRALNTTENHILMKDDFTVTAASQASLVMLNVEPSALAAGEAKIQDWVAEWDVRIAYHLLLTPAVPPETNRNPTIPVQAVLEDLKSSKGTTLCVDATQMQTRAATRSARPHGTDDKAADTSSDSSADDSPKTDSPAPGSPILRGGAGESMAGSKTWVRAHLQVLHVLGGGSAHVLHWTRLPTDAYTIGIAVNRRRASLEVLGVSTSDGRIDSGGVTSPSPAGNAALAALPRGAMAVTTNPFAAPMGRPPLSPIHRASGSDARKGSGSGGAGMRLDVMPPTRTAPFMPAPASPAPGSKEAASGSGVAPAEGAAVVPLAGSSGDDTHSGSSDDSGGGVPTKPLVEPRTASVAPAAGTLGAEPVSAVDVQAVVTSNEAGTPLAPLPIVVPTSSGLGSPTVVAATPSTVMLAMAANTLALPGGATNGGCVSGGSLDVHAPTPGASAFPRSALAGSRRSVPGANPSIRAANGASTAAEAPDDALPGAPLKKNKKK